MDTNTDTTHGPHDTATRRVRTPSRRITQAPGLPPDFDADAFTRKACARSGVSLAVTDPVALSKLRVLTRPDT